MRAEARGQSRRGQILVYFVLMLFALMSLAALVVDLGFARLTQRQMQSAVDSAAIEGLRQRDALSESDRRQAASDRVAMVFDDDLDPTNGDPASLSAGPVIAFGPEPVSVTAASQSMTESVYDPVLQPNLSNDVSGDMLSGTFLGAAVPHREANDYSRDDFAPGSDDDAFLVRMRRTDEDFGLFTDSHSSGPTVPVVFGRGSLIDRDLLARGTVVRATAIADARNVFSVGFAEETASPPLRGLAPFTLERNYWNGLTNGSADSQTLSGGEIGSPAIGRFFTITGDSSAMPVMVGRELPSADPPADDTYSGYVPIHGAIDDGVSTVDRVVGYGLATAVVNSGSVEITREASELVAENATANFLYPSTITSAGLSQVLASNAGVAESLSAAVSAR